MTGAGLAITYVIGTYPSLTTTFIDREIEGLLRRGADVAILSVRRPAGLLSPSQRALQGRVRYLLPPRWFAVVRAHARALASRPRTYVRSVWTLLAADHQGSSRSKTLAHFAAGVYAASIAEDRRGIPLHAHFLDRATTMALVAAPLLDTTYSCTAHANDIYVQPVLLRDKIRGSTFTATCTQANRRYLVERLGDPAGTRIRTIRHGLDLTTFTERATDADARTARGDSGEHDALAGPILLTVAQLKEKKGLNDLLAACRLLADRAVPFRCRIVGDGPLRSALVEQIRTTGLDHHVALVGALPFDLVLDEYRAASVFVLPSVIAPDGDRDGIPNVILEAMAMCLPVVSTTVSGIPEAVVDGETGLLVPPRQPWPLAQAIEDLICDPVTSMRLGRAGRRRVEQHFDIERNVDRLLVALQVAA